LLAINVQSDIVGKKQPSCTLILGIWHSNFLEVRTMIDIHNNDLLGESKIQHFYLDISRIIGNFHFSIVPVGNFGR